MKILKKLACTVTAVSFFIGSVCLADSSITLELKKNGRFINASGTYSGSAESGDSYVTIRVKNENSGSLPEENLRYFDRIKTDKDGRYSFDFYTYEGGMFTAEVIGDKDGVQDVYPLAASLEMEKQKSGAVVSRGIKGERAAVVVDLSPVEYTCGGQISILYNSSLFSNPEMLENGKVKSLGCRTSGNMVTVDFGIDQSSADLCTLTVRFDMKNTSEPGAEFKITDLTMNTVGGKSYSIDYGKNVESSFVEKEEYDDIVKRLKNDLDKIFDTDIIDDNNYYEVKELTDSVDESLTYLISLGEDVSAVADPEKLDKEVDVKAKLAAVYNDKIALLEKISSADADMAKKLLTDNALKLGLRDETVKWLDKIDNSNDIVSVLSGKKLISLRYTKELFEGSLSYMAFNGLSYGNVIEFINDFNDYLNISFDDYKDLDSNGEIYVQKQLAKKLFSEPKSVKEAFDKAVSSAPRSSGGSSGTGPSGSGGKKAGSSGSIGSVTVPAYNTESIGFKDLQDCEWARVYIESLAQSGIIAKTDYFRPYDNITRAEFVKMLIGSLGIVYDGRNANFLDVGPGDWYYAYVNAAYSNGLVTGISESEFCPNGLITRQDMAAIIARALKNKKLSGTYDVQYSDSEAVSGYASDAVKLVSSLGIMNGMGDGSFAPQDNATRAMAAKVMAIITDITK